MSDVAETVVRPFNCGSILHAAERHFDPVDTASFGIAPVSDETRRLIEISNGLELLVAEAFGGIEHPKDPVDRAEPVDPSG